MALLLKPLSLPAAERGEERSGRAGGAIAKSGFGRRPKRRWAGWLEGEREREREGGRERASESRKPNEARVTLSHGVVPL